MRLRMAAGVILALGAVVVVTGSAEAFGRRQVNCCHPVATSCYPHSNCYCPPPVPIPIGVDCACNRTDKTLRVHITSGFGHVEAIVPPGHCLYFHFRKDNMKNRVLSAFTLDNDLVANFDFAPLDQCKLPHHACLVVGGTAAAPTRSAPARIQMEGMGGGVPLDGSLPFNAAL